MINLLKQQGGVLFPSGKQLELQNLRPLNLGYLHADVELRGVDIYDPVTGEVHSASDKDVAAWFLDTDYDGKTFHICQAFFPGDPDAWEKLQRALRATIDPEAFETPKPLSECAAPSPFLSNRAITTASP